MNFLKRLALIVILVLCASAVAAGALAVSAGDESAQKIQVSEPVHVQLLHGNAEYTFSPATNSMYGVYLFPAESSAAWLSAKLYRENGSLLAEGSAAEGAPCAITARLTAGESYRLLISGAGDATLEIARKTLGRCYDDPILLGETGSYAKLIARAGDAHWYEFTANAAVPATIAILPEEDGDGLHLSAYLISAAGRKVAESLELEGGACALYAELEEGKKYYIRVSAAEGETGAYHLQAMYSASEVKLPTMLAFDRETISFNAGGRQTMFPAMQPAGAHSALIWRSSAPSVATVTVSGEIIAVGPGEATVTAYAYGGLTASCEVVVQGKPLSGIRFADDALQVRVGETEKLEVRFTPAGAYAKNVVFSVDDESVASVDAYGMLTALSEGTIRVTAAAADGAFTAEITVTVEEAAPRYRALLIGEQLYHEDVNKVRTGAINTVQSLSEMLGELKRDGQGYETTMLLDTTRAEAVATLRKTFEGAGEQDVSLFYITCHGYYVGGMSYLQFHDGSMLSAYDLERELRRIPGTVVVMIDCCGSGGVIGEATSLEDFNKGIVSVFSGMQGESPMRRTKYKVITSASLDEDSYRISFDEDLSESAMATVFARALCDGAGWDITRARRAALRADTNMNRSITLQELYQYTSRRVGWYLQLVGGKYAQNVQVYPEGDPFVVFEREAQ